MGKMTAAILACVLFAGGAGASERVQCRVVADNWVEFAQWSAPGREPVNHGSERRLIVSGRESFALLAFDLDPVKDMRIEKATLRMRRDPGSVPLTATGISTVSGSSSWSEGGMNYLRPGKDRFWSYPGSDLAEVTFGLGGSLYAYHRARDAGGGWYEIDIPSVIVTALVTGDQFGLMLTDEKGQTHTRHAVYSRESADPPVLIVEGSRVVTAAGPVRMLPPQSAEALGRTSQRPGSVILRFGGAKAARYELRYSESPITAKNFHAAASVPRWMLDPLAPKPNPLSNSNSLHDEVNAVVEDLHPDKHYYFAARGISATGQAGPVSLLGKAKAYARHWPSLPSLPRTGTSREAPAGGSGVKVWAFPELHKVNPQTGTLLEGGPVWRGSVRLTGARNEFVAFQVAVESDTPVKDIAVTVDQPLFTDCKLPPVFSETGAVQLYREWMMPDEKDLSPTRAWYPDALIPLSGTFDLPSADNAVPRQRVQPVFADIYIPHDAAPGVHRGSISVHAGGRLLRRIPVEINVLPLALPDELSFLVDLNAYSGVNEGYDIQRGTPEYRALLQEYHRLAHLNRTNLDILGYGHSGKLEPDQAPPLTGEGAETKVESWKDWDAHFGPIISGEAFADLPRAAVPVQAIYLALFENWPGDLRKQYKWNIAELARTREEYLQLITRHGLESGPIEDGFPREYQDRFSAVARQFAEHLRERNWTKTRYQIFFNDKYYSKDPSRGNSGKGVSWWLLDEPNHHDDYRALSFFGWLGKRWLKDFQDVPIVFRTDIGYIEFIRDQLPGLIDINCVNMDFFNKNRYLMDNRNRFGHTFWNYASTNHPRESNVSMRAWAWRAWTSGADGIVPWLTVRGGLEVWNRAEALTLFYPGSKFGVNKPYASIRLKGFRRGQQDVEYLMLLARKKGWDREAVARAVTEALDLTEHVDIKYEEDAGSVRFEKVSDGQLEQLRLRVAAALAD